MEQKTIYELIVEYVEKNAPEDISQQEKDKMIIDRAVALLRV